MSLIHTHKRRRNARKRAASRSLEVAGTFRALGGRGREKRRSLDRLHFHFLPPDNNAFIARLESSYSAALSSMREKHAVQP